MLKYWFYYGNEFKMSIETKNEWAAKIDCPFILSAQIRHYKISLYTLGTDAMSQRMFQKCSQGINLHSQ